MVPNGVEASWWRAGGAQDRSGEATSGQGLGTEHARRPVHVVSAMRFVSRKRPLATLDVLRGARAILDRTVPMRATLVGEGPQRRLMERYLRTRGMDWVSLPGRVDREALRRLHHSADVYLSTARLEAFGIAALEARAAGVPVVATRGTGADDFLTDGVDGLLGDSDVMLAGALAHLVGDDALRDVDARSPAQHPPAAGLAGRRPADGRRVPPGRGARAVITVSGERAGGVVVSFVLGHGEDPVAGLAARGWSVTAVAAEGVLGDLTLRYAVVRRPAEGSPGTLRSGRPARV